MIWRCWIGFFCVVEFFDCVGIFFFEVIFFSFERGKLREKEEKKIIILIGRERKKEVKLQIVINILAEKLNCGGYNNVMMSHMFHVSSWMHSFACN